ncbi:PREDICTED: polyribonucleotide nucleotidyltransferase 1, mitochondrial [Papilio xuthus]|uniref:polyribonucleotide nucleotidyltransferase n=1 Tax=Papilio xuthus TaxID=66420 RepID=A0AAJ6ZF85_PAPXU|nr:PREDICTED: polyribonucleotide nucleotidyltransferase 1, mitochondrial [Papilio xuthus]
MLNRRRFILSKLKLKGLCYCRLVSTQTNVGEIEVPFSNGTTLKLSTGRYARFADGACVATLGNTSVLATVVAKAKAGAASFLPLVVDYRQKAAAAGRIPTNFLRRELGPTEREILTSRLVDRSVRPLFPQDFTSDTQLACNTLAVDGTNPPETVAINAASAALALSDVPWHGPIGAVRLGQIENELIVNPTRRELERSSLNLVVAAAGGNLVVMLEGGAKDVLQQDLLKAIKLGAKEAQHVVRAIERLASAHGKRKREYAPPPHLPGDVADALRALCTMKIREILSDFSHDKTSRDAALAELRQTAVAQLRDAGDPALLVDCFNAHLRQTFRDLIFETDVRCDGRALDELRKINCEVSLYEPLHGSALFQRGQTQVLCTVAFDSPDSALKLDPLTAITSGTKEKSFFLHYEFPAYATGEVGGARGAGPARREAGHGALAERGLAPVVPHQPYTVRLTAEVLESNGSSSMASVCGGSLALLDAGVALSAPAAGVAVGLVSRYKDGALCDYRILTDLLGIEDYMGDMDFKVAGTKRGVTALQADVKTAGLPLKVVMEAVQRACDAKARVIDIMNKCIDRPRQDRKESLPVTEELAVEPHERARLLGPAGINLKRLYVETGVQLSALDERRFAVFAPNAAALEEARARLEGWLSAERAPDLEFGAVYTARVVELRDCGVMVTLHAALPPALLHNSQLDHRKVQHPSALGLAVGSEIHVKYFGRDPVSGQMRLSRKVLTAPPPGTPRNLDRR